MTILCVKKTFTHLSVNRVSISPLLARCQYRLEAKKCVRSNALLTLHPVVLSGTAALYIEADLLFAGVIQRLL